MSPRIPALIVVLCLYAGLAQAQVFPRIEKDEVKKRVAGGTEQPEEEPQPAVDEKPAEVDGAKALKRYQELLAGYIKDEKSQRKAMTKHTDDLFAGVRDYYEGIFLLRMGFYKDAERKLKDVGVNVRNEKDISTPELLKASDDIKAGKVFYYRMIAVILMKYESFKTEKEAEAAWSEASKEGIKIRRELELLVDRGKVAADSDCIQEMTAWMLTAKREWLNLHKAEFNVQDHPENLNSWLFLAGATGIKQEDKREYTPHFLKQRAALVVIREFWPASTWMKGGMVDAGLGNNYLTVGQLDDLESHYEQQPYHTALGAAFLAKQKEAVTEALKQVEALKNK
jgi:hypothetical protein